MKENPRKQTDKLGKNVGPNERLISTIAGVALTAFGVKRRGTIGGLAALAGGALLFRGTTGHCPVFAQLGINTAPSNGQSVHINESVTIDRTPEEVYAFWRDLSNLPRFMRHIEAVSTSEDTTRSHWTVRLPRDIDTLDWTADITSDRPGEEISWRSIPGSDIYTAGTIRFRTAPGQRGTEVHASIDYRPPASSIGQKAAAFFNRPIAQLVKDDIRRFKAFMEAGEVPTIEGQASGRKRSSVG